MRNTEPRRNDRKTPTRIDRTQFLDPKMAEGKRAGEHEFPKYMRELDPNHPNSRHRHGCYADRDTEQESYRPSQVVDG